MSWKENTSGEKEEKTFAWLTYYQQNAANDWLGFPLVAESLESRREMVLLHKRTVRSNQRETEVEETS